MAKALPRSTPAQMGVDPKYIKKFLDAVYAREGQEIHGMMILKGGKVIAETYYAPYRKDCATMLFSLSKSFTSTAVGFAVSEGLLSVDDKLISFFDKEQLGELGPYWDQLTLHHVLSMNTGHVQDTTGYMTARPDGDWVRGFFSCPIEAEPGTRFLYNTGATYMLSAVVQKVTGMRVTDYLTPRLFEPLGIEKPFWEQCPRGIDTGGFGLMLGPEDVARFGQFLLQKGAWEGKQLLPAAWLDQAAFPHSDNSITGSGPDWSAGYGYQFWRCVSGGYRGDGAFGQYCVVLPQHDMVIAITSNMRDMQQLLTDLWVHLLPGVGRAPAEPGEADAALAQELRHTAHRLPGTDRQGEAEQKISGKTFGFRDNWQGISRVKYTFGQDGVTFALTMRGEEIVMDAKFGAWTAVDPKFPEEIEVPYAGKGGAAVCAWEDGGRFVFTLRDLCSPFVTRFEAEFFGGNVNFEMKVNVGFGEGGLPTLTGSVA